MGLADLSGLNCVVGDLYIDGSMEADLSALSSLQGVAGSVTFTNNNFTTLHGLEQLTTIGFQLQLWGNPALTSLSALSNLTSLFEGTGFPGQYPYPPTIGLQINENANLNQCWVSAMESQTGVPCGNEYMQCYGNTGTQSCEP